MSVKYLNISDWELTSVDILNCVSTFVVPIEYYPMVIEMTQKHSRHDFYYHDYIYHDSFIIKVDSVRSDSSYFEVDIQYNSSVRNTNKIQYDNSISVQKTKTIQMTEI